MLNSVKGGNLKSSLGWSNHITIYGTYMFLFVGRGGRGEVDEEEDDETGLLYLLKTFPQYDCDALMNLLEELGDVEAVIRLLTLP